MKVKASICCITYNHDAFIEQAILGFVMQKTNFDFEIIIADDASTDNTQVIIRKYQEKFPNKIKYYRHEHNVGMIPNFKFALEKCVGEYIAICEGDDYWTSADKLQLQVDELDRSKDLSFTFHKVSIWQEEENEFSHVSNENIDKEIFNTDELIRREWFINTCSIVLRNESLVIPDWFTSIINGDYAVQLLCSLKGSAKFINSNLGVYRKHKNGVSVSLLKLERCCDEICDLLRKFNNYTDYVYNNEIITKICLLKSRVVEIYAYNILELSPLRKEYWVKYLKVWKYACLTNSLHLKYILRYLIPIKRRKALV